MNMATSSSIRVLVRHADPVARVGLVSTFRGCADFTVVDEQAPAALPAMVRPRAAAADVVVADYDSARALVGQARAGVGPCDKVLVLSGTSREWEIRSALESGVRGFLVSGCGLDELALAVRAVHRGQRYLSPPIAAQLAEILSAEALTAREEEVLRLLVEGMGNKSIARRLGIAVGTVKSHLKSIFEKLHVSSRTQAIHTAERRGLLSERAMRQM
jgi:DNA-binding NarL/FixJ family response regulator